MALTLAALVALAAIGCGGSDDSGTSTATTTEAGQTALGSRGGDDKGSSAGEGSASFRTKGGDNSIQDFGDEADESEREAAEANIIGYLEARADGDWKKSCEYLAKAAVKPLEQLAQSSPRLKGKGCAAIIGALSAQLPPSSRANPLVGGVASLRIEGDQGFALFRGPHGAKFFVPMAKEGDEWKVGALAASEFP